MIRFGLEVNSAMGTVGLKYLIYGYLDPTGEGLTTMRHSVQRVLPQSRAEHACNV